MAITSIKVEKEGQPTLRSQFMTIPTETGVIVEIFQCDDRFIPIGEPQRGDSDMTEKAFHMKLRQQAYDHGQYVYENSTDPDWNNEIILNKDDSSIVLP